MVFLRFSCAVWFFGGLVGGSWGWVCVRSVYYTVSNVVVQAVSQEELVASKMRGEEVYVSGRRGGTVEDGEVLLAGSAQEFRGEREEEFVGEIRGDQGVVQPRAALYEEKGDGVLGPQNLESLSQVHRARRGRRDPQYARAFAESVFEILRGIVSGDYEDLLALADDEVAL